MLLKDDSDKADEEVALLDRSSSFVSPASQSRSSPRVRSSSPQPPSLASLQDSTSNPFSDGTEPVAASSASTHTLSSPPHYYPPLPSTSASSSALSTVSPSPPIPHSAHVSYNLDRGHLVLSHVLNLNVSMPPLLAFPQASLADRSKKESVNGYFRAECGRVDLRLGFVGREDATEEARGHSQTSLASRRDRVKVFASSRERMKIHCISRTPNLPISMTVHSFSSVTLDLPRDFRGPVHLVNSSRSKLVLSPQVQQAFTHISTSPPISFIGSIAGWSGASPTEEDTAASKGTAGVKEVRLDELWINIEGRGERINISFAGDLEEEERSGRELGRGAKKTRQKGFWRSICGCCCSYSSDDYDM